MLQNNNRVFNRLMSAYRSAQKQTPLLKKQKIESKTRERVYSAINNNRQKIEQASVVRNLQNDYDVMTLNEESKRSPVLSVRKLVEIQPVCANLPNSYVLALKCVQEALNMQINVNSQLQKETQTLKNNLNNKDIQIINERNRFKEMELLFKESVRKIDQLNLLVQKMSLQKAQNVLMQEKLKQQRLKYTITSQMKKQIHKQNQQKQNYHKYCQNEQQRNWHLQDKVVKKQKDAASRLREWIRLQKQIIGQKFQIEKIQIRMRSNLVSDGLIKKYSQLKRCLQKKQIELNEIERNNFSVK